MIDEKTLNQGEVHDLVDWYIDQIKGYEKQKKFLGDWLECLKDPSEDQKQVYLDKIDTLDERIKNMKSFGRTFCSQYIPTLEEIDDPLESSLLGIKKPKVYTQ